jgi:hypothetical protein
MAKTSTAMEVGQEGSLREGLEAAIRERVTHLSLKPLCAKGGDFSRWSGS